MCQLWKKPLWEEDYISVEDCYKFIPTLKEFGEIPITVHIIGGEPFLEERCLELVRFIAQQGFRSVITSNGYFIGEEMARRITKSGLHTLNLSLESLNREVHDRLRGVRGSAEKVIRAIDYLKRFDSGLNLGINTIILRDNLDDIIELTEWVNQDDKLGYIYFMAVMQPFGSVPDSNWYQKDEFRLLWPDPGKVCLVLDRLKEMKAEGYKIGNPQTQLEVFKSYFSNPQLFVKKWECNLGRTALNINVYGDVYLCFFMDCMGNIRQDRLKELWYSAKADKVREKIRNCRKNCELLINCYYEDI